MKGKINIEVTFPIISLIENDIYVARTIDNYNVCVKSYIPKLNKLKEYIIDSKGYYYKRKDVTALSYINIFGGFSLKAGGFGVCYVDKELEKLKDLTNEDLKVKCKSIIKSNKTAFNSTDLNINQLEKKLEKVENREHILEYLFFFAEPSYFKAP